MSCVLRIWGVDLDPDRLVRATGLVAYRIDRKGEAGLTKSCGPRTKSAVHADVSSAEFEDLPGQIADAIAFLRANHSKIQAAVAFPGVDAAALDFAVRHLDVAIDSKYLGPEILSLAGGLGLGIELSIYP